MSDSDSDVRAARRAQREAERAARAQRKADAARQRALEAARAGGLFEGMEEAPRPAETPAPSAGDDPAPAEPRRQPLDPQRRRALTTALAVASAILVVVTGLATWQYVEAREAALAEQAVTDAPLEATDAAREIATQMFTYDHRTVDEDLAAVRDRLTDPALEEFVEQSMPAVSSAAKQQEATVYATVAAAAPQEVVDADTVTVLVMLNRMVSTKEAPEAASSASRLSLDMVREDGTWKLAELTSL